MNARTAVGTVADLHASAARMTGLDDFGTDDYTDGLAVLLDSYSADEDLTPLGSKMSRVFLRGALAARLLSEAGWREYPEHASAGIDRPVFVTGLPRTGTTALHRLLTADPAHQGLELWLTQAPQPRPPREIWAADPVYAQLQAAYAQHHVEYPEFMGVHYIAADQVEECWQLLRQSMRSISFECLAHLPGYSSWLAAQDWTGAYRRHRRNLQLIGLRDAGRRWVLKNPSHLFALDELLAVYPDALVIQTHRPPRDAIASACSLAAHATDGWSRRFTSTVIGSDQLALWARGLDSFMAARHRHEAASQHVPVTTVLVTTVLVTTVLVTTGPGSATCGTRSSWPTRSGPSSASMTPSGSRSQGSRPTRCEPCRPAAPTAPAAVPAAGRSRCTATRSPTSA